METQRRRTWLLGAALGILLALALWPETRWLLSSQLAISLRMQSPLTVTGDLTSNPPQMVELTAPEANAQRIAAAHPDDYLLQLAAAFTHPLDAPPARLPAKPLRALTSRFPDRPSLYAAILRMASQGEVTLVRPEEFELMGESVPPAAALRPSPNGTNAFNDTPESLAAFDSDAAAGERLDPDNAYFPFLRSVGLFAAHRDDEALAAIQRAATKPMWHEYYDDEVEGKWRLHLLVTHNPSALLHTMMEAAVLLPHYAQLRAACRVAVYKAMEAEQAGHSEDGLAIRRAVMQCGSLMRVQSHIMIGSLVGIALTKLALEQPGGTPPIHLSDPHTDATQLQAKLTAFDLYLHHIGHAEESRWTHAELNAGDLARRIARQGVPRSALGGAPLAWLWIWWVIDLLLLSNILWMLACGGVATWLANSRRFRARQEAHPDARRIAGWHRLGLVALGGLAGVLCCWGYLLQVRNVLPFTAIGSLFFSPSEGAPSSANGALQLVPKMAAFTAIVPVCAAIILTIMSRLYRVPLRLALVRGFRGIAVPVVCVLLLAYSVSILGTLRYEAIVNDGLTRTLQHEGKYFADLTGQKWPGAVP
jgi:hypothetical protein